MYDINSMSTNTTSGNYFDGVVSTPTITASNNEARQFIASSSTNQFITTASEMSFWTRGSTNSVYTFKDSSGTATSSLSAKNGLFTGQVTAQYETVTSNASQTVPGVSITGPLLNSDNLLPLLKVQKTEGGVTTDMYNVSPSFPVLRLFNSSTTPTYTQYSLANNLPSGSSISHLFGRNTSANAESFLLQYYYDTLETNRKFTIKAWGDTSSALEVYQSGIVGTSAITGSVVVNGDFGSTALRSKKMTLYGTSGSASIEPASTTTSYKLTLPSSIGSSGNYLQLSSVSGTDGTLAWAAGTGSGGGSSAYIATLSRTASGSLPTSGTQYTVSFGTPVYELNSGITYQGGGSSAMFQNTSGGTLYIHVTTYLAFATSSVGDRYVSIIQSDDGSTVTTTVNYTRVGANTTASQTTGVNVSAIVVVANNKWFGIRATQTSGGSLSITGAMQAQVLGGSGLQSITLSALSTNQASTLFTTTAQQTGFNPTVSFDLAQTPTGSGKFVLQTSPTISGLTTTGTLTTSAVSSTSITTPKFLETVLLVDTDDTVTYPTGILTLTSSNTSVLLQGSVVGFQIIFPDATTLTTGQIIKITNNTSQFVIVKAYLGIIILEILAPKGVSYYQLTGTNILTPTVGIWKSDGLIDKTKMYNDTGYLVLQQDVNIKFNNSAGQLSLKAPSDTTTYDFILPKTPGVTGQVLTSAGGTNAMTWQNTLTDSSILNMLNAGHIFGTSSTSSASLPILRIRGISNTNAQEIMRITNYSQNSNTGLTTLAPNLQSTQRISNRLGVAESTNDSISKSFNYSGSGSTSNSYSISFWNMGNSTSTYPPNIPASTSAATFRVTGGITGSSIYAPTISTPDLTATTVNSTTLNATTLNINTINFSGGQTIPQFYYGTTTPTFWWAYDSSDPSVTLSYPTIPKQNSTSPGQVANQSYKWQKVGYQYSFSLNLYVELNTSSQLHVIFVRTGAGDPDPPIPQGQSEHVKMEVFSSQFESTIKPFGVYVPATYFLN